MMPSAIMPLKVLIVDDHVPSANVLMWAMEAAGYQVQVAFNGITAIEALDSYIPHIVLLDITMPYMDGYELCEILRDDPRLTHSLFIAETGWKSESRRDLSKSAGFHHHLVKPINIDMLLTLINREFKSAEVF